MGVDLLGIGRSGLMASKKQLSTASHNISNANTEGYSRQKATLKTGTPISEGDYVLGSGSQINEVKRVHDELVERRLIDTTTMHNFNQERGIQLNQIEEVFNEVNSEGLNKILNKFFNSFRELSNQPENDVVRSIVRENAKLIINDFKRMRQSLNEFSEGMNRKIKASAEDINTLTQSISFLNKKITELEVSGGETGDLRDQRDLAIKELSNFFEIKTYQDEQGQYVVNVQNVGSLVVGGERQILQTGLVETEDGLGRAELFFSNRPSNFLSGNIKTGTLGAIFQTRENEMANLVSEMDTIAYNLAKTTNAIHRKGFANIPLPVDNNGNVYYEPSMGKITGINFFEEPVEKIGASSLLNLSKEVRQDLSNIATGLEPNSPGDNRIAIAISKIQHEKILNGGTTTMEEQYLQTVGNIGLISAKNKVDTDQSSGILAQVKSLKERISGVSIDEETTNMIKYQQAYEASARVIKTADEMFQAVLGMMR